MEGGLDEVEVSDHGSQIDPGLVQSAMCDPVPGLVMAHRDRKRLSAPRRSIEHHRGPAFERESGQSRIVRVVQVPTSADLPIGVGASMAYGFTAGLVDGSLQLAPAQEEVGPIVEGLVDADTVRFRARKSSPSCLEELVDPRVESIQPRQVLHRRARRRLAAVKGTSSSRARKAAMCQRGSSKNSDLSLITKCPIEPVRSSRPFEPMIQR